MAASTSPDFSFNYSESAEDSAQRLQGLCGWQSAHGLAGEPASGLLFTFSSYELRDVLLYMNAHSSNFVSERIGALVGGAAGVRQFLIDEVRLSPDQVTISRVSGREHNRMTPRGLLAVIRALVEETKRQGLEPADIMPVASDDSGTLRRRLMGTPLEGAVIAKTGTLTAEVDGGMATSPDRLHDGPGMVISPSSTRQPHLGTGDEDNCRRSDDHADSSPRLRRSPQRQLLPSSTLRIEKG